MKIFFPILLSVFLLCIMPVDFVQAEVISKFEATYNVSTDGEVRVQETIVYDFEGEARHGIFRTIENKHPQPASVWYKRRYIDLEVSNVTKNGVPEPYVVSNNFGNTEVKIGNEVVTLDGGVATYVISYTLKGALSYGDSGTELYYNVTGNDWEVPIQIAVVSVSSNNFGTKYECYQGIKGDTNSCTNTIKTDSAITFTANNLKPSEGLTIAAELDAEAIQTVANEQVTWILFGSIMATLWSIGLLFLVYRFRRSAYVLTPVIAQYEPYKDFLPIHTGYLADNQLNPQDITAGVLYLAQQGFIKIVHTSKSVLLVFKDTDYEITLLRPIAEVPTKFLTTVIKLFFKTDTAVGTTVTLESLQKDVAKNAEKILHLHRDIEADLIERGFYTKSIPYIKKLVTNTSALMLILFGGLLFVPNGIFIIMIVVLVTIICGAVVVFISRRTTTGYEAKNHLDGFKLFLSVTDKQRFDFHNAPEKSPELFMQYLPYAVALGVEDKWAKVFEGITIPQPEWYSGGSVNAFSAAALSSELTNFSTSFSASSGVSGSSGGGSSGGGGGGGGGGSW